MRLLSSVGASGLGEGHMGRSLGVDGPGISIWSWKGGQLFMRIILVGNEEFQASLTVGTEDPDQLMCLLWEDRSDEHCAVE